MKKYIITFKNSNNILKRNIIVNDGFDVCFEEEFYCNSDGEWFDKNNNKTNFEGYPKIISIREAE